MRPEAPSLSLKPTPFLSLLPGARRSRYCTFRRQLQQQQQHRHQLPRPLFSSARAADDRGSPPVRIVSSPEPPWLVLPPSPPEKPFPGEAWPPEMKIRDAGATGIPLSLRMVQMKRRMATSAPRWTEILPEAEGEGEPPENVEGPTGRAVTALVCMIGELQRTVLAGSDGGAVDEAVLDRASRDRRDSFLWLLRRVFFCSPNLVVFLLLLLADYVAFSTDQNRAASGYTATPAADEPAPSAAAGCASESRLGAYLNWFDVGIQEGNLEAAPQQEDEGSSVDRRRRAYERAIADGGGANSLILSNYAMFLYRVANDHDRAEQYFQRAAAAEPRDAEAVSRYAFFLWQERGDIGGAEEMFLEAIDVEPGNPHYSSTYAWFLWKTGALDTCYPLDPPPPPSPPALPES